MRAADVAMATLNRRDKYIVAAAAMVVALLPVNCTNTDTAAEVGQHNAAGQASSGDSVEPAPKPETKSEPNPATISAEEIDAKIIKATNLVNRLKFDDARVILDQVLSKSPHEGRALALLAQTHLETNNREDALATANNCVDADAQQAFCWVVIAILEQGENHLPRALEAYHKYLEIDPDGRYAKMVRREITRIEDKVQN
jgi:tetratricopeptide (TPR) repeat protein